MSIETLAHDAIAPGTFVKFQKVTKIPVLKKIRIFYVFFFQLFSVTERFVSGLLAILRAFLVVARPNEHAIIK